MRKTVDQSEPTAELTDLRTLTGLAGEVAREDGHWALSWSRVPEADRYEVHRLDGADGEAVRMMVDNGDTALTVPAAPGDDGQAAFQVTAMNGSAPVAAFVVSDRHGHKKPHTRFNMINYLRQLRGWKEIAKQVDGTHREKAGEPTTHHERVKDKWFRVRTQNYSLSKTPKYLVIRDPNADVLWPGAFVQGGSAALGALSGITVDERTPIDIFCDLTSIPDGSATVKEPKASSVHKAIADMVRGQAGAAGQVYFDMKSSSTLEAGLLEVDVSAKYMGFSGEGSTRLEKKHDEKAILACFLQGAFTVSCVPKETPNHWFSRDFTQETVNDLESMGRIGSDNPPLYVSSVTYGRSLIFAFVTTADTTKAKAALKASYEGTLAKMEGSVKAEYEQILQQASLTIITRGGNAEDIINMIKEGQLAKYFGTVPKLDEYIPMSYTLKSLLTGEIAKLGETANYSTVTVDESSGEAGTVRMHPVLGKSVYQGGMQGPLDLRCGGVRIDGTLTEDGTSYPQDRAWEWRPSETGNVFNLEWTTFSEGPIQLWVKEPVTVTDEQLRDGGTVRHHNDLGDDDFTEITFRLTPN